MITPRDEQAGAYLARFRCLLLRQICDLVYGHPEIARTRMRELIKHGFAGRFPKPTLTTGRPAYVFYPTAAAQRRWGVDGAPKVRIGKSSLHLDHTLECNDCLIAALVGSRDTDLGVDVMTENEIRATLRKKGGISKRTLIPDGIISLRKRDKRSLLMLEVDRGSTPLTRGTRPEKSIRGRLEGYSQLLQSGSFLKPVGDGQPYPYRGFRVLMTVSSIDRLKKIRSLAAQIPQSRIFWFGLQTAVNPQSFFQPIWSTPVSDEDQPLVRRPNEQR